MTTPAVNHNIKKMDAYHSITIFPEAYNLGNAFCSFPEINLGGRSENHASMQIIPHEAAIMNTPSAIGILKNDCRPSRATKTKGMATRAKPTTPEIQRRSLCGLNHLAILLYVFGVTISFRVGHNARAHRARFIGDPVVMHSTYSGHSSCHCQNSHYRYTRNDNSSWEKMNHKPRYD